MNKTTKSFLFPNRTRLRLVKESLEGIRQRLALALSRLLRPQTLLRESSGVGVLAQKDLLIPERVLLLDGATLGAGLALGSVEDALDFGAVDEAGKIGLGDHVGGEEEALLAVVNRVELLDGGRGPDDEAAEVTTGGELEKVEGIDGAGLDTGEVAEALDEVLAVRLGAVDDERTASLAVAAASELALSGAELLRLLSLLDILTGTDGLQETKSGSRLLSGAESGRVDDEGDLGNGSNLVAAGEEKGGNGGGGKGRGSSKAPSV